ncbi:MAG: DDE-type integrase/transposase/recombinase [Paracoccaceae bacterium]
MRLYQPLTIITDDAPTYAKVISEINERLGPEDAIRHVTRTHLNNRIESDHAALKRLLRPTRGFRDPSSAKATLKGI